MQCHSYAYLHPSGAPIIATLSIHIYETAKELLNRISLYLILGSIVKIVDTFQFWLKLDKHNEQFTPKHTIFVHKVPTLI
jgi:hypothetical protein